MTDTPLSAPAAGIGRSGRASRIARRLHHTALPVLTVVGALLAIWYLACIPMNAAQSVLDASRADQVVRPESPRERRGMSGIALAALNPGPATARAFTQDRPRLPAPHQVAVELWNTTAVVAPTSNRSLIHHAWVTFSATLLGFAIGTGLGILLAVGIVHSRVMDRSVMPWAIVSQTVPIIAIAPMIIVVLYSIGIQGIVPKAIISAYLSFFPLVVGMVKGLRSPDAMQLDLLRTYAAGGVATFWKLRLPASAPYLFASLKIGIAASLVGAIVGELPTGAVAGLGARLLAGSYYGQTVQIWSALFAAAILAGLAVGAIGLIERAVLTRMGLRR
ncbi:Putative aliphatic sulfonates transport permease protein SsuC [Rhodobacteraceae bacterium THAF1]|uniref:ABC transporter permease n=1 Tax=Palleronia sp. THAF1 TaxID=2587842 RepID=UPI000F3DA23B|nr:ABC transporter permease [Palleronia sp. THAF1]QFU08394.1 alkanesulfonate transporter permease subunit [Palleronia sp. THAF1]VDC29153.1 Putative aliphatic sulfonates transport permease protein SsuC [Rhodobacteraceae bacterium THAF1]